ncbi:MAG: type II toxin-antitoxin system RelE/ParE family toxin [Dehalococcoidia bacterium]|jgi:plasmid stabilization system protein ParE
MKVRWSQKAKSDIRAIRAQRAKYSVESSDALVRALARRTRQLAEFPDSGRMIPEFENTYLRELIEQEFRIMYERFPDSIVIICVIPARMSLLD